MPERAEALRLPTPISAEAFLLMGLNWSYSSRKARGELGYRSRPLETTLRDTVDWYRELIDAGRARSRPPDAAVAGRRRACAWPAAPG